MNYSICIALLCAVISIPTPDLTCQEEYYNAPVIMIDGEVTLVSLDDLDRIARVLMFLPDYFESERPDEEYLNLLLNYYAQEIHDGKSILRFIEFPGRRSYLDKKGVDDLKTIAQAYADSAECIDVVITASDIPASEERVKNVIHSLRSFGVPGADIKLKLRDANTSETDGIVKVHIETDPN